VEKRVSGQRPTKRAGDRLVRRQRSSNAPARLEPVLLESGANDGNRPFIVGAMVASLDGSP
jgi:hypothetical protein